MMWFAQGHTDGRGRARISLQSDAKPAVSGTQNSVQHREDA